ncbi:Transforming protein [Nymphaea thermarum]|nr:Transforming protein [Nymphaea thermarum]
MVTEFSSKIYNLRTAIRKDIETGEYLSSADISALNSGRVEEKGEEGNGSWKDIAANFRSKTSRQCRRRWYAYLTSDCKKGGWSEEEDRLLCEAQKMYGNKWTEIAKVVSGRTDNAVKNRFTTLCKKRAKYETSIKENQGILINSNHGPFMLPNQQGAAYESYTTLPLDRIRYYQF